LKNSYDDKLIESIEKNLFTETVKNRIVKIKIVTELMKILEINNLFQLSREVSKNFNVNINNSWLDENLITIKKLFDIRGKKYGNTNYYTIYQLLITLLKNIFDEKLFICKKIYLNKINYYIYLFNNDRLECQSKKIKKFFWINKKKLGFFLS